MVGVAGALGNDDEFIHGCPLRTNATDSPGSLHDFNSKVLVEGTDSIRRGVAEHDPYPSSRGIVRGAWRAIPVCTRLIRRSLVLTIGRAVNGESSIVLARRVSSPGRYPGSVQ